MSRQDKNLIIKLVTWLQLKYRSIHHDLMRVTSERLCLKLKCSQREIRAFHHVLKPELSNVSDFERWLAPLLTQGYETLLQSTTSNGLTPTVVPKVSSVK